MSLFVGGLQIIEPAVDLAIVMAITSSFSNRPLDPKTVFIGEIGLGGEVRSIARIENRLKEAIHMGFTRCILPQRNLKGLAQTTIAIHGIESIDDAFKIL